MKNYNTPRTLADCEFTSGYSTSRQRQPWRVVDLVIAAMFVGFLASIILWS